MSRNIAAELESEHASMARLLDIMERQLALFESSEQPDYDLMQQIAGYFIDFPEHCHHPKEDLVAAMLIERVPARAEPLRGLAGKHEELAHLTQRFAQLLQRVLDEAELPRGTVLRAAREFIASQRYHMAMENEHFLPLAREVLGPADLAVLESQLLARQDPLRRSSNEERYAKLRDLLLASERRNS
jgi:hemerythrin-like domain-containing protein